MSDDREFPHPGQEPDLEQHRVRFWKDFWVAVSPRAPQINGFDTTQRDAENKLFRHMRRCLSEKDVALVLNRKGIREAGVDDGDIENHEIKEGVEVLPNPEEVNSVDRQFTSMLHMGSGDLSGYKVSLLKHRLQEALDILCGLQQGPDHEDGSGNKYLDSVVGDLVMALTGQEIRVWKCPQCGRSYIHDAASCPHCPAPDIRPKSLNAWLDELTEAFREGVLDGFADHRGGSNWERSEPRKAYEKGWEFGATLR